VRLFKKITIINHWGDIAVVYLSIE